MLVNKSFSKKNPLTKNIIYSLILLSTLIHISILYLNKYHYSQFIWENVSFHSAIEIAGSFISFFVAYLLIALERKEQGTSFNIFIASALVGMGVLDGMHALIQPGQLFVWLHSTATFWGGCLFSLIFLPIKLQKRISTNFPPKVFWFSLCFCILSIYYDEFIPTMVNQEGFTILAELLNICGGILLLFVAVKLYMTFRSFGKNDDLLFILHCTMFGLAAIMFEQSNLWDITWWGWHILRFIAYGVALWFALSSDLIVQLLTEEKKDELYTQVRSKESELKTVNKQVDLLSHVANISNAGVVICDNKREVVWVNRTFTSLTGYGFDEVKGRNIGHLLQGSDTDKKTVQQIRNNFKNDNSTDVEMINYHKNGDTYWVNLLISSVKDSEGNITHFVGIQNDISERKQQEELIIRHQRVDAIGQLAAGICHDFNNILGILTGNMELLSIKNDDANLNKYLGNMNTAILRATTITTRILKSTEKQSDYSELVDIDKELSSTVEMLRVSITKNINIISSFNSGKTVFLNKDELIDSVINIIINAKHAIEHHGKIEILTHNFKTFIQGDNVLISKPKEASQYIVISVRDTGKGISPENISKIFDPFFSTRSNESGTGLGLSMLAEFLNNEGVGLTIQSHVGIGTTMNLWLPEVAVDAPLQQELTLDSGSISGLQIVYIDDEASLLELVSDYFQSEGANITCFSEPQKALSYIDINQTSIDLVITDNCMPGDIQGVDVYKHITENINGIPCLIMTGFSSDVSKYVKEEEILQKPIRLTHLKKTVSKTCKRTKNDD